ncbi:hypothetical protein [Rhodosalinus sp. 5P4]|uniref:hypothetical protein n=1 Tax=Rhodosalinus sp. 5P4 TaxID=3239196 RepID=UPI0035263112
MYYRGLDDFLTRGRAALAEGPVAIVMVEDDAEVDTTLRHHMQSGFRAVLALMPDVVPLAPDLVDTVHRIACDPYAEGALQAAVNRIAAAAPGTWFFYCYNAEFLFYPFCETRTVGEMLAFHAEERRSAMLTYVIDLYAADLDTAPNAVCLDTAQIDRTGYYALARKDPAHHDHPRERQLDFHGGLRWRFEEHVPPARRKIDRISLFRARPGLALRGDHTFNDEEYNTYACPWHHNLTAAVVSFRTAKALRTNPGSRDGIDTFRWHNSVPFEWHSRQLLDLGLMEPGQWF